MPGKEKDAAAETRPAPQGVPEGDARESASAGEMPGAVGSSDALGQHDRAVLAALRATDTHPTAAQLYEEVRARYPRIGQATVYRALTRLLGAGLAVDVGRDALGRHYDARTDRHDHAVCSACGRVLDLPATSEGLPPEVLAQLTEAAGRVGMRIATYEVRLYGLCPSCAEHGTAQGERTTVPTAK